MADPKTNSAGLDKKEYVGKPSTLCGGCGHDSVTRALTTSFFETGVPPHQIAKLSGIGCSSKSITYLLEKACGFNGVHGRMPSVGTGAGVANHTLSLVGVSGDGDTASIGMGQFVHVVRKNLDMVYVMENNGVYGLTKGQFSATTGEGDTVKKTGVNPYPEIDCCALAATLDCGFVARAFAANQKQMVEIFKAAISYRGLAFIEVISPCVTFNPDIPGSSKTYAWAKENQISLNDIGYIPEAEELPEMEIPAGEMEMVTFQNGAKVQIRTVEEGYNPHDRSMALTRMRKSVEAHEMLTGILFIDEHKKPLKDILELSDKPLATLPESELRPSRKLFDKIMDELRTGH